MSYLHPKQTSEIGNRNQELGDHTNRQLCRSEALHAYVEEHERWVSEQLTADVGSLFLPARQTSLHILSDLCRHKMGQHHYLQTLHHSFMGYVYTMQIISANTLRNTCLCLHRTELLYT